FLLNDQLLLAATLDNAGFLTAFQESRDSLPLNFGIGAAYRFWPDDPHRISLGAELEVPLQGAGWWALGAEGWLWNLLALRAGIRSADAEDWLNLGAGLRWQRIHIDYALSPLGTLGLVHRFSASFDFGSQRRLARPELEVRILTKQFVYPDGEVGREVRFVSSVQAAAGISYWELVISDRAKRQVRRFEGRGKLPVTIVWDGHNDQGTRVELEDYYLYHCRISDRLGYTVRLGGEILPVSFTKLPRLKVLPRDIFAGKVSFTPKSFEQVREWSLAIVSNDGRTLRNYAGAGNIPKDLVWDGMNEEQYPVAIKEGFHFVLNVKDKQGNEVQSVAPLVVVDTGTKVRTDSGLFLAEKIPFKLKLPAGVKIQGWVLNILDAKRGEVIRTFDGSGWLSQSLVWDSRDDKGCLVSTNRKYNYVLRMQDSLGNVWQQASVLPATDMRVLSQTPEMTKLKIEQILFDFDEAELKPDMFEKLRKTADLVKMYLPEKVEVFIEGHTDEIGSKEYNLELSLKRAKMVMRYLVEEEGLQSSLIRMEGYGKHRPLKSGRRVQTRARNRRVEITLTLPR
ncbi:OmpA family protein, partial [bacterium]|nr:OmpA family protein [bacterium]